MGGVLFDIGAPIYISDLQHGMGGVVYDMRPPIYYIRCALYKYDVALKSCSNDSGIVTHLAPHIVRS